MVPKAKRGCPGFHQINIRVRCFRCCEIFNARKPCSMGDLGFFSPHTTDPTLSFPRQDQGGEREKRGRGTGAGAGEGRWCNGRGKDMVIIVTQ